MDELNHQEFQIIKKTFDLFDKDGDGKINKQEITIVFQELNIKLSEDDIEKIMNQLDQDGNNTIQFAQFISVFSHTFDHKESEAWLFQVFSIIDQDCDGYINRQQLFKIIKLYNLDIGEKDVGLILEACQDGSAKGMSFEEFSSILRFK